MATKTIEVDGIGPIQLIKRAGNRSIRLSVTPSTVRVSMPRWTPFSAGQAFALHNIDWIRREQAKQSPDLLETGQKVGKLHYLRFEQALDGNLSASRVTGTEVIVRIFKGEQSNDSIVQERARAACIRALKREAERLLPPRLQTLAKTHNKQYTSVAVKQLKRRWGSCDSHQAITLNLFLMELPWEFIDYVLLHELAHTIEMNHGTTFWATLSVMEPRARVLSKHLKNRQPIIGPWQPDEA